MAHNRDYKPEDIAFPDQVITESELVREMQTSYIDYAMSVIVGRALPDVRDGLKPVHRRILYSMYEGGLTHSNPYKKCATAVGDVLGHYHPHGDVAVYDALVRLAQDFSLRVPLIDGHGNFGSIDGDPPAAYRYTEARMSRISEEMLRDIDKETVDWDPNFDETRKEPRVLPSRFPNLLVNGSSGIAVGMATNIPPHNLREVIDACICLLDDPESTLNDLMRYIKGPDFPTKGIIIGRAGIRQAYATGRGRVLVRARTEFEEYGRDHRTRIIVTELPYQVNKRQLIRNIAEQVKEKRLDGISDLRDESDRNGMRIVIELKREANAQIVLNRLFMQTQLQSSFSIIMLALVENQSQPRILSLRHILDEYLRFQEEVVTRRTRYDLRKSQERAHLLEGLLIAQDNIDEVIRIIRSSYDNAKQNLMDRFGLDEVQAQAILEMRLRALQGLDREKLQQEYNEIEEKIKYYQSLLADPALMRGVLKEELTAIRNKYGDDRRTEIQELDDEIDFEDLIENEECVFTCTRMGYIKRIPAQTYRVQNRGGRGVSGMTTREEDVVSSVFATMTHNFILFFTNMGRVYRLKGYQIPLAGRNAKGTNMVNLLSLDPDEKVTAILPVEVDIDEYTASAENVDNIETDESEDLSESGHYLFFVTRLGTVKRVNVDSIGKIRKSGLRVISLREDDSLISVFHTEGASTIILASHNGRAIRFNEEEVRVMGRTAAGVRGIDLNEGDYVVGAAAVSGDELLLSVSEKGYGKRTRVSDYPVKHRAGLGVISHDVTEKTGPVAAIRVAREDEDLLLITSDGQIIRTGADAIRICGRASQGVILMRTSGGIIDVASVSRDQEDGGENGEETPESPELSGETENKI